jgi:acyl dehydratase
MELGLVPDDASAGLNYGLDKLRFLSPVLAGDRVRLRVVVQGVEEKAQGQMLLKTKKTLEIERDKKIALVAESLSLLIP